MARGIEGNELSTPKTGAKKTLSSTQKSQQSGLKQRGIAGFFKPLGTQAESKTNASTQPQNTRTSSEETPLNTRGESTSVPTPKDSFIASSPPTKPGASQQSSIVDDRNKENESPGTLDSSPSRKVRKHVNYAESDDDEDDGPVRRTAAGTGRALKRRRVSQMADSDEDDFAPDVDEVDREPSLEADTSESDAPVTKRRSSPKQRSPIALPREESSEIPTTSTAQQWRFDPNAPVEEVDFSVRSKQHAVGSSSNKKQKAHMTEPDQRYPWLATIMDADRNPLGHPDYDPRTIYIPPLAWSKFSPFEKQYWEIKQKFWDTIVFFKKGKFYELYENDATVGHQLFDLKLTDRVNMRMVGVPEASLDHWANQFVAKGFKIARVDQMETALGKDMRERDIKGKKEEKVIRRELAAVLTSGTLVDGGMLQDDLATYCAAIKEVELEGRPYFGIAFVDTATAQFQLAEFHDDPDMTRFETFVAQVRPGELLLEKGNISAKALRILKNNTSPTTIWNYLKPEKEFLTADKTRMTIDGEGYFDAADEEGTSEWPQALEDAKNKHCALSAFGALTWYLTTLKIERGLITCRNFGWYDPIRKASSLVLDGQSLINLEIFANTFDGSTEGTLFTMLNRCVTPFGKRMLKQWVCHPLADTTKINHRLDAVESLNADRTVMDRFTASLSRLPDLERLISRIHAGQCRPQDFLKVVEGFEQIEYTMSLLGSFGEGEGLLGQLITAMPDLAGALHHWKDAFDRTKAKNDAIFVPQPGVEESFDKSQGRIDDIMKSLNQLLSQYRKELGSSAIKFTDNGKEIFQLEIPLKIKGTIPKNWKQMSATKQCKRWYTPELEALVQDLKEAYEMHAQTVKELGGRFCARFDEDYTTWLAAVKIVAQLDCLISLAKASTAIGLPSCRPEFIEDAQERSVLQFQELRHPCIETTTNFIPNDIELGGEAASMTLLTGANAAGKSTILRMTCIAVILAQIGCYVPCVSARMTPVDRIMSRLGAQDNIFAGQSTFMVELSETKKILSEATPRSLVILDELGRGTSSYDGVAVAQAVLHHVATHVGALGYFATHYHSLATEFSHHPEITPKRMAVRVEHDIRDVTFLYKLENGVAEGSYGMHCAAMCGIANEIIDNAERAAQSWEHTERIKDSLEKSKESTWFPLGMLSDLSWILKSGKHEKDSVSTRSMDVLRNAIEAL